MKKQLRTVVALTAAAAMTMASVMTASADTWRQDSKGWRVETEDGSYLTNQWCQSLGGLWYYFGEDGYHLRDTITPDGYYVDRLGVWVPEEIEDAYVPSVQEAVKMYKDYLLQDIFSSENFVFVDLNGDGVPECIAISQEYGFRFWVCAGKEVKTLEGGRYTNTNLSYIKDGNTLSICTEYSGQITRSFRQLHVNELFDGNQGKRTTDLRQISYSTISADGNLYIWDGKNFGTKQVTRESFDEFNNSFGTFTEIPLDSAHTYKSIDEAYEAFVSQ
ncbi:hypothetical protein D3Z58_25090 [Clostridiaceae bacterium]|nr:hypothetical protein [Clostridiaceae bacterium]